MTTFFYVIFVLALFLLLINLVLAPHFPYLEKLTNFECGYHSFVGQNRLQFFVSFFVFGLVYLLFDLEILLLYPYSVSSYLNGPLGLLLFSLFCYLLSSGFVFEIGNGALTIYSRQNLSTTENSSSVRISSLGKVQQSVINDVVGFNKLNSLFAELCSQPGLMPQPRQKKSIRIPKPNGPRGW